MISPARLAWLLVRGLVFLCWNFPLQRDYVYRDRQPSLADAEPTSLVIKRGEHGALLFHERDIFAAPALPLEEVIEHMATSIEEDPSKLAYAAPCAQMFVFRAEVAPAFDRQVALTERALELCPAHRNARLVLADLLTERAMRSLDGAMPWSTGDALNTAVADVKRAEELYPQLKRLDKVKQRARALGYRFDDD